MKNRKILGYKVICGNCSERIEDLILQWNLMGYVLYGSPFETHEQGRGELCQAMVKYAEEE